MHGGGHVVVELHAAVDPGAEGQPAAAPAEQDAPVAGGAEVVHQRAAVGEALAAGPAQLLDHVGDRLGEHDVGRGDAQARAQLGQRARRRAHGQHGRAGPHPAAGGLGHHSGSAPVPARQGAQRAHVRALEHGHAALDQAPAQPEREARGVQRGEVGHAHAAAKQRRGAGAAHLVGAQREDALGRAQLRGGLDRGPAHVVERGGGGDADVAGLVEPGVHVLGVRHQSPISVTAALEASSRARAPASPKRRRSAAADSHIDSQKPPFRPLGPWPQTPASSSATRAPASTRSQAVQSPVKPPPITTTSASIDPSSGGRASTPPASSSHQPVAV